MKKKITKEQALGLGLAITMPFVVATCGDEPKSPQPEPQPVGPITCGCLNGTAHEPENFPCCEFGDCTCTIAEPAIRSFPVSFDFPYSDGESVICNAIIQDARTKCGSANLEQLNVNGKNIVTIIDEAIMGAFNTTAVYNSQKNAFRRVFGQEGGVTIIVDNSAIAYKMKATDATTIYIHINYLISPANIQQNIFDAVVAMNGGASLPLEISKAIVPVPQYNRQRRVSVTENVWCTVAHNTTIYSVMPQILNPCSHLF